MKKHLCFCLLLLPILTFGQASEYKRFMDAGHREVRAKNYEMAGKKFTAALEFAFTQEEQKAAREARVQAERMRVAQVEDALKKAETVIGYFDFREGRAWAYNFSNGQFALIDDAGKKITDFIFTDPQPFNDIGLAVVKKDGQYYLIDRFGKLTENYDYFFPTNNNCYKVKRGDQYSFLDSQGKQIPGCNWYRDILSFENGIAWVNKGEQWGLIGNDFQIALAPQFTSYSYPNPFQDTPEKTHSIVFNADTQKYGIINNAGQVVIPCKYDGLHYFKGPYYWSETNKGWGVVDLNDKEVVEPQFERYYSLFKNVMTVKKDDKWGFIIGDNLEIVMPEFDAVQQLNEINASVKKEGKWGMIDSMGKILIPPQFDSFYYENMYFQCNPEYTRVLKDSLMGFVNSRGQIVLEPQFDEIECFNPRYAKVKLGGHYGLVDTSGRVIVKPEYDDIGNLRTTGFANFRLRNLVGMLDSLGNVVAKPQFDDIRSYNFDRNGCCEMVQAEAIGLINKKGEIVVPPKYSRIVCNDNGVYSVCDGNLWGLLDSSGKSLVKPRFQSIGGFHEGFSTFELEGKVGIINKSGQIVLEPEFDVVDNFSKGMSIVMQEEKLGILDNSLRLVLSLECSVISPNGMGYSFKMGEKWGLFFDGNILYKAQFDTIGNFSAQGPTPVQLDGKWGLVGKNGQMVVAAKFDHIDNFYFNHVTAYQLGAKWGLLDTNGQIITNPLYERIEPDRGFTTDNFFVQKGSDWGLIDNRGKELIAPKYDSIEIQENYYLIKKGEKYGLADTTGQILCIPQYDEIGYFENGLATVKKGEYWGFIDQVGKLAIPCQFARIEKGFRSGPAEVQISGSYEIFHINKKGEMIVVEEPSFQPKNKE